MNMPSLETFELYLSRTLVTDASIEQLFLDMKNGVQGLKDFCAESRWY